MSLFSEGTPSPKKEARMPEKEYCKKPNCECEGSAIINAEKEARMPDMGQIGEAIYVLIRIKNNNASRVSSEEYDLLYTTALSVLQHVKEHGLGLKEEEIEELAYKWWCGKDYHECARTVAKAIVAKQKGVGE